MTDAPDRRSPAYRAHIRELAESPRPRADRKHRDRGRPAPDRRPCPWVNDNDIGDTDD